MSKFLLHYQGNKEENSWFLLLMLLALLILYKLAPKFDDLGSKVKYLPSALRNVLERMKLLLNATLKKRWWTDRPRSTPLKETRFPWIALITDVNSIEIFLPKGRFKEAKHYWDGKNWMYTLKMEIVVTVSPPHYVLFVFKGEVGSMHDFAIHKKNYQILLPYLKKTNEEIAILPEDRLNRYWGIVVDKAYDVNSNETPDGRRFAIQRNTKTSAELSTNTKLSRLRVPVEQFLGHMWQLWTLLHRPYSYSHEDVDVNYENMVLLTNDHIRATHPLQYSDLVFYRTWWKE